MELEKINNLEDIIYESQQKINDIDNIIQDNEKLIKQSDSSLTPLYAFLASGAISSIFVLLIVTAISENRALLGLEIGLLSILILAFLIFGNNFYESNKMKFFKKNINFIKNDIYFKNRVLIEKKDELIKQIKKAFPEDFLNEIYLFYKNQPYSADSDENFVLTNNLRNIKTAHKKNDYLTIIKIYQADREKYNYLNLNNKI